MASLSLYIVYNCTVVIHAYIVDIQTHADAVIHTHTDSHANKHMYINVYACIYMHMQRGNEQRLVMTDLT